MSDLFGNICKYCKDPAATHDRLIGDHRGYCFIMSCNCPGYERDNLKYLEECYAKTL